MTAESSSAGPTGPGRPVLLGQTQYGKAETRVVRVVRDGATHHLKDLNVSVALSGDMDEVHLSGSNANVLPTTPPRTPSSPSPRSTASSPRAVRHPPGPALRHEPGRDPPGPDPDRGVRLGAHPHRGRRRALLRPQGPGDPTTEVAFDGTRWQVVSGLKDLVVMNTTDSEFWATYGTSTRR